ncbi:hypothetical protein BKA83DRAFT_4120017 [Pisolithus microcarpus]|nr:hypothetical protein BKA83DRAFT_4120017 [Pisolithus microcarpus]
MLQSLGSDCLGDQDAMEPTDQWVSCLIPRLSTWFGAFEHADIVRVGNRTELIVSTIAADAATITSVFNRAGIPLNNRSFLAYYTGSVLNCWSHLAISLASNVLSIQRGRSMLSGLGTSTLWDACVSEIVFTCRGYQSPFVEEPPSRRRVTLDRFGLDARRLTFVPFRNGYDAQGVTNSMAIIMDYYASQLAEQYGSDVASDILPRSRSNLGLESSPYAPQTASVSSGSGGGKWTCSRGDGDVALFL